MVRACVYAELGQASRWCRAGIDECEEVEVALVRYDITGTEPGIYEGWSCAVDRDGQIKDG